MHASSFRVSSKTFAAIGLILILPTLYFVCAAVLQSRFGNDLLIRPLAPFYSTPQALAVFNFVSPVVFLGGCLLAALLNLYPLLQLSLRKDADTVQFTAILRVKGWNLSILLAGVLLVAVLLAYVVVENFALH